MAVTNDQLIQLKTGILGQQSKEAILKSHNSKLQELSGTDVGDTNLGASIGNVIPDNATVKQALQALDTRSDISGSVDASAFNSVGNENTLGLNNTDTLQTIADKLNAYVASAGGATGKVLNAVFLATLSNISTLQALDAGVTVDDFLFQWDTNTVKSYTIVPLDKFVDSGALTGRGQVVATDVAVDSGQVILDASALHTAVEFLDGDKDAINNITSQVTIPTSNKFYGDGTISGGIADKNMVEFSNLANQNSLIKDIEVRDLTFENQPPSVSDNFAALHFVNTDGALAQNLKITNVDTAIRFGYILGSSQANSSRALFNHITDNKGFGIECIESNNDMVIGNIIENDGVQKGLHAVRFTATQTKKHGFIGALNSIKDRVTTGISVQMNCKNGVMVGNYVENCLNGFRADISIPEKQNHMVSVSAKVCTGDSVDITGTGGYLLDVISDSSAGTGVRTGNKSSGLEGSNNIRVLSDKDLYASKIRSSDNIVEIIADGSSGDSPVLIEGDNNIVEVICTNCTGTNLVFVVGSNNIITIIQHSGGAIGLKVSGNDNLFLYSVTGVISVGGNNNKFIGTSTGPVYDNGTGNSFYSDLATKAELNVAIAGAVGGTMTGAEIATAYEAEADTNKFTDSEKTKVADSARRADLSSAIVSLNEARNQMAIALQSQLDNIISVQTVTQAEFDAQGAQPGNLISRIIG